MWERDWPIIDFCCVDKTTKPETLDSFYPSALATHPSQSMRLILPVVAVVLLVAFAAVHAGAHETTVVAVERKDGPGVPPTGADEVRRPLCWSTLSV